MNTNLVLTPNGTLAPAYKLYRALIARSARRTESTAIVHNGGKKTVYGCVCGAKHSCATNYRHAKHVREFRKAHAACMANIVRDTLDRIVAVTHVE